MNNHVPQLILPQAYKLVKSTAVDKTIGRRYRLEVEDTTKAFVTIDTIERKFSFFQMDRFRFIDCLYKSLEDTEAIIEVLNSETKDGNEYIYTIVKNKTESNQVLYVLKMQVQYEEFILNITGRFESIMHKDHRDLLIKDKLHTKDKIDWVGFERAHDPYNLNHDNSLFMKVSELYAYDSEYENHPLSLCRLLVDHIIETA